MKVGEANGAGMQGVKVRGLDHLVTVRGNVAVTLVIRDDEDHVGLAVFGGQRGGDKAAKEKDGQSLRLVCEEAHVRSCFIVDWDW